MRKLEGNLLAECARDTCELTCILEIDAYLYAASLNGVVRQWSLPFNPKNVEFRGQLWLHNKNINDMAHWRFGSESKLFTACDDRECRVWDLTTNRCVHAIEPNDRQQGTLRSVACSDHMLFIGSSNGNIYVYLTEVKCRRTDRHVCNVKGAVQYCPQCTLRYGPDDRPIVVSALAPYSQGITLAAERDWHPISCQYVQAHWVKTHLPKYLEGLANAGKKPDPAGWRVAKCIFVSES